MIMAFKVNVGLDMLFKFLLLSKDFFMFVVVYHLVIYYSTFVNIYNGIIFPSLNPAKIFRFISR